MKVQSLSLSATHTFTKDVCPSITLLAGIGVEGDAHCGKTVKHRSRVKRDPSAPNLRQVHLISSELLTSLNASGFQVSPGQLGENTTTEGIDLLSLPLGTLLRIGSQAEIEVTGLRNPCSQIDNFQSGLLKQVLEKDEDGNLIRKAGIMAIVLKGGRISSGDTIEIELPPLPHSSLEVV